MNATHEVLRRFPGPGSVVLQPGTQVDASKWRNASTLVESRYLRTLPGSAPVLEPPRQSESKKGGR